VVLDLLGLDVGCWFLSAWGSSRSARKDLLHGIGLGCGSAHRNQNTNGMTNSGSQRLLCSSDAVQL
jgi:hypothetical protein